MRVFHKEMMMSKDGKLQLDGVPFAKGEPVRVFVYLAKSVSKQSLKGTVLKYEKLFAPADENWASD